MVELKVNYESRPAKRTRSLGVRVTSDELNRYNLMAAKLGHPLAEVVRALCEAQYNELFNEGDEDNG